MKSNSVVETRDGRRGLHSVVYLGIIIGLAVTLACMTAALVIKDGGKRNAEARLNDYYFESLVELSDSVDEVVLNLSKLSLPMSRGTTGLTLNELSVHASEAVCSLSRMPIEPQMTYSAMKLLNQIVDFSSSYNAAVSRGLDSDGFVKSAAQFRRAAEVLQQRVDEMEQMSREKGYIVSEGFSPSSLEVAGDDKQESTPDYPEMIYDGPFSDSKLPKSFKGLEDKEEITEEQALEKFARLMGITDARTVGRSSEPDAYEIEGKGAYAAVSVRGGMILELSVDDNSGKEKNLTEDDAYRHAAEYAAKLGYGDLMPVWYYESESTAYINMAPTVNDAVIYTDLVKVKISLTDGSLLGLEATGYCRNHIEREVRAVITERFAADKSGIDYDSVRLCVIPDGETEAVCYEVHGEYDGMEFFVYVDAVTGENIKVLKVVGSGGGRLTA